MVHVTLYHTLFYIVKPCYKLAYSWAVKGHKLLIRSGFAYANRSIIKTSKWQLLLSGFCARHVLIAYFYILKLRNDWSIIKIFQSRKVDLQVSFFNRVFFVYSIFLLWFGACQTYCRSRKTLLSHYVSLIRLTYNPLKNFYTAYYINFCQSIVVN